MKLLIKILSISLVVLMSNSVIAGNVDPGVTIKKSGEKTLHFDGKEMMLQRFEVSFQNSDGATLFSEYITDPTTFVREYNLEELPNGQYSLHIIMANKTQILPVLIEAEGLKIDLEQLKTVQ